tara:strand:+ start:92 stop:361 length:270 start_codon:yes stop_codon:yes gene_type:complete
MTDKEISQGHPWTDAGFFSTYELAKEKVAKINSNELQTKIRRRANGSFLVKYRKDPALIKEETKNVKKSGKSRKGNTVKREPKFDASSI